MPGSSSIKQVFVPASSGVTDIQASAEGGNIKFDSNTNDLLKYRKSDGTVQQVVSSQDQVAAGKIDFPDLGGVAHGVVMASTIKFLFSNGHSTAAGVETGTVEIAAGGVILDIQVVSVVTWDSGTSAILDVGDDNDTDGWFSQINLLDGNEMEVGDVLSAAASGDGTNAPGKWGGVLGAYLVESTGRMGRVTAGIDSGNYQGAATEVEGVLTTVGTVPSTGESYMTVFWTVPTELAATYVAT